MFTRPILHTASQPNIFVSIADWTDYVKIAAINCAEQNSCADYNIQGTPTIRAFFPNTPHGIGQDMDLSFQTVNYLRANVLILMGNMQSQGIAKQDMPSMLYYE